jgi:predicted dithiol-disulfide oxidoreductase (DUF899 family)
MIMATRAVEHAITSSRAEWLAARRALLTKEKELTRATDEVNRQRRELPWMKVEKEYVFDGSDGNVTLADLFGGRSQLIIRHFMFGPGWKEGCVGCSFASDHAEGALVHLENHDVSYAAVSRAPWAEIEPFQKRMGWHFKWVSSYDNDFNFDYHVSFTKEAAAKGKVFYNYVMQDFVSEELSGLSVFYKDEDGNIFHTYSCYARGDEKIVSAYMLLDLTPKGRNERVNGNLTDWVRHHDRYGAGGFVDSAGRYQAPKAAQACCHEK